MCDVSRDPLDVERLQARLPAVVVEYHAVLGSTNDRALELAADLHQQLPVLVVTETQTSGRGRQTNRWWSAAGALTFSVLLEGTHAGLVSTQWSRLALAAGVALCRLIEEALPDMRAGLKWPNDVHVAGRKVAGILVETWHGEGVDRLVLGMGVNVSNSMKGAPPEVRRRAVSLSEFREASFERTDLLGDLVAGIFDQVERLAAGDPSLSGEWQSRCVLNGKNVTVQRGAVLTSGICRGIDKEGALLLEGQNGLERVFGGHVVSEA